MSTSQRSKKAVTLEGKTRLPHRVQDLVLDFGSVLASIQNTSASANEQTLAASMKNFVALDPVLDNSMQMLGKIDKMVDSLATDHNTSINQSIVEISEVQEKLQRMERNAYFSNTSSHKSDN